MAQSRPKSARERLGLNGAAWAVSPGQWRLLRLLGRGGDGLSLPSLPAQLARRRLAVPGG